MEQSEENNTEPGSADIVHWILYVGNLAERIHQALADYFSGKWALGKPYMPKGKNEEKMENR